LRRARGEIRCAPLHDVGERGARKDGVRATRRAGDAAVLRRTAAPRCCYSARGMRRNGRREKEHGDMRGAQAVVRIARTCANMQRCVRARVIYDVTRLSAEIAERRQCGRRAIYVKRKYARAQR